MRISFHPEALAELEEALTWYDERNPDAGRKFAFAIDHAIDQISEHPDRYAFLAPPFRSLRIAGFPYQIIYRESGGHVRVQAIAHAKRRPGYWKRR